MCLLGGFCQAKAELPNMQGALERTQENQYHLYNVDGAGDEITELARVQLCGTPRFHCWKPIRPHDATR